MNNTEETECVIAYYRAQWKSTDKVTPKTSLGEVLWKSLKSLKEENPELPVRDSTAVLFNIALGRNRDSLSLHVAFYHHRESASTVPHQLASKELGQNKPGKNWDYLDGEGMIYISGNDYFVLPNQISKGMLLQFVRNLIDHSNEETGDILPEDFTLKAVANKEVISKIIDVGIKKINLDVIQYSATSKDTKNQRITLLNSIKEQVLSIIGYDKGPEQILNEENMHVQLIISMDGRKKGNLTYESMKHVANDFIEEDDQGISLETKDGVKINKGKLSLRKKVSIKRTAKSISHADAWEQQKAYYKELKYSGALDE